MGGEPGTAYAVFSLAARCNARSFGENDDPEPVLQPILSLLDYLLERGFTRAPIDRDRIRHCETPAEEWYVQQFFFEHPDLRREYLLKGKRFPGRLVLGQYDAWRIGNMLGADDAIINAAYEPQKVQHEVGPT